MNPAIQPAKHPANFAPKELAERWGLHIETVYRMLARGELTGFRVGKGWRITSEEVGRKEKAREF